MAFTLNPWESKLSFQPCSGLAPLTPSVVDSSRYRLCSIWAWMVAHSAGFRPCGVSPGLSCVLR
ncbi:MAG: hypothetical protein ACT4QA_04785 [Panacagrimonas sp.]